MNGSTRDNVKIGTKVKVVQKQDQTSGKLTEEKMRKKRTKHPIHFLYIRLIQFQVIQ